MNKSFLTIKTNIGTLVQDSSSSMSTHIGAWVNNRYRDIISRYEWEELLHNFSLTATATVSACPLAPDVDRLEWVLDATNSGYLAELSEQSFYQQYYDVFDDTGTPDRYFLKWDVVKSQPASAEQIVIRSSAAGDTSQTLLLRGITSLGVETYESLSLNGTTAVTASNSYTRILELSKSVSTTGNVSVYHNDNSTVLSIFAPEQLESRYLQMHLNPIPTGAIIYHIKGLRRILPLSQNNDYPVIRDTADVLEMGGTADSWRYKRQFQKAREYEFLYEKMLAERIFQREKRPNLIHQMQPTVLNRNDGIL